MSQDSTRRDFLKLAGTAGVGGLAAGCLPVLCAEPEIKTAPDHFIPFDKRLDPRWVEALTDKGGATWYRGDELDTIAMPIGGLCTGQLYLAGDGRLVHWDIFNRVVNTGFGATSYRAGRKPHAPLAQGFALRIASGGKTTVRSLDRAGFSAVRFCGEYPIGTVEYRDRDIPVAVTLEAFSPFIPLNADDSGLPATVMQFTLKNTSGQPAEVTLAGWLENAAGLNHGAVLGAARRNRVLKGPGMTMCLGDLMAPPGERIEEQPDFGSMGLAVLGDGDGLLGTAVLSCNADVAPAKDTRVKPAAKTPAPKADAGKKPAPSAAKTLAPQDWAAAMFAAGGLDGATVESQAPATQMLCGAVGKRVSLAPGATAQIAFVVGWCFPNLTEGNNIRGAGARRGNYYANRFADAAAVLRYVAGNFDRLAGQTRLWRRAWYDSTLPHWLLDRLFSTVSTLATSTCQRWANGRFWAWEGVGCCAGTCGHVWNYAHALARLFPELERTVREMQDYNPNGGFDAQTGAIRFRGESDKLWAGDSQPGYVLKVLREHQMSPDAGFLKRLWPRVRKSIEFLFAQDGNADGLIEGQQHNTYDINFFGANTMVGSLYLAALRAGEEMAREAGDADFAATCRKVFETGEKLSVERLFNGEYFIQQVDLAQHPKHQYAEGCLADQLFGQGWAHQVGLGYVYPKKTVESALRSIWKYDWAPDIAPQNKAHPPQRWFAMPGEAGLFTCTWPKSKHLGKDSVLYRDEIWTGIEYQVAGHMVWEGMLTEALAICRAVHDRYHPAKRNPWNEVECGDHYARGMASYGVFLALCGFEYDGPKGRLGFAPKLGAADFRAAFTTAEGWGTFRQKDEAGGRKAEVAVAWGKLRLKAFDLELPDGARLGTVTVRVAGRPIEVKAAHEGHRVTLSLPQATVLAADQILEVAIVFEGAANGR